ncbi:hypothetical protein G6F70_000661 [Rhizopus microsporus]|nr:hypothetical protein G6F71_000372 [Rhizopus microsporus]KAG1204249.1 hypothetical protein G6F70_000661 [Rhizopus microsporus]KAG1238282.1 hypothetical protein G6F67_000565 [Rhizopus microsporus]KAG1269751.1 hypothetical protein G6F68_000051 [Rhizopus microsporus]CEI99223.1 hypothetical protein RMCBS344292_13315 [Rhizopus microsporus]
MMTEENTVGPLATPTRFLIESGEWNLTPNFIHEINPFDCNMTRSPGILTKEHKWSNMSTSPTSTASTASTTSTTSPNTSPKQESILSPPTPPMSLSQSPTNSSASLSISPRNSVDDSIHQDIVRRNSSTKRKRKEADDDEEYKPKSTGGRKRRIVFEGEDAEDKRKKFLERNRVAAYKCRQKKKTWMQELEQKAEISTARNEELRSLVTQLKEESMYLRNLLLTHGNCDCESVQAYLRRSSAQITSRRESTSSEFMPYYNTPSTGLTPFLNTVINKSDNRLDYFSSTHHPMA